MTWTSTRYDHHPRFLDEQDQALVLPCDESLCVSKTNFDSSFSCYAGNVTEFDDDGNYGEDTNDAMCANGYIPEKLDDEPIYYFTCCPPMASSYKYTNIKRHCSDVITLSTNGTAKCVNASQPYLRPMKNRTSFHLLQEKSFICCDSEIDNTTNFLNITECVPYQNENYDEANIKSNTYGTIQVLKCTHPGTEFIHPNYIEDSSSIGTRYECCKSSHETGPFITDSVFKGTIYPQIFLSTIACICCTILIIALLIPLVKHLQPPTRATTQHTSSATATATRTITSAPSTTTSHNSDYSSYNLYLIYSGVPDLILNVYLVVMYSSYALGYYNSWWYGNNIAGDGRASLYNGPGFENALLLSCSTANLYVNTIISYEVYVLLRNNRQVVRHTPPSFRRISISAGCVYLLSMIVFCAVYFGSSHVALLTFTILVSYILPIGCFFLIWGTIIYRKYIPSSTGRLKEVVLFFYRIVLVFCFIWLPAMCLLYFSFDSGASIQIGLLLLSVQPILSTIMAMTKTDVRKYTIELLTLSIFKRK